jgi:hypothetical protein
MTIPPTDLLLQPGRAGEYSVLQWTAPTAGKFKILVLFEGLDSAGPTTADVHVLVYSAKTQSTTPLFSGQITSYQLPLTTNLPPREFSAGDTISFAVGSGSDKDDCESDNTDVIARIESK